MWRPRLFQRSKNKGLLCEAVERGDIRSVMRLLEMGVDINTRDEYEDCTLLMRACWNNQKDMVELLLTKSADVNETSGDDGYTALMIAVLQRYENIVNVLLMTKGINVTKADHRGRTAIHWAAMRNRVTILERLLSCCFSVDISDNDGRTPLWWAVYNGHVRCVDVLMKHGASHQHESESDGSPLEIAKRRGHSNVVEMMEEVIRLRSHVYVERDMPIMRQQYEQKIAELQDEVEKRKEELRQSALVHESEVTRLRNEMEQKEKEIRCLRMSAADRAGEGQAASKAWLALQLPGDVMHAVVALAGDQWSDVGLELEYEMSQINFITSSMSLPSSKLHAILRTKAVAVGTNNVVGIILSACQRIPLPICAAAIRDEVVRRQERLKIQNGGQ